MVLKRRFDGRTYHQFTSGTVYLTGDKIKGESNRLKKLGYKIKVTYGKVSGMKTYIMWIHPYPKTEHI